MQFKTVVAFIAASAVTAMAMPAAVPEDFSNLQARAEQVQQAAQHQQAGLVHQAMQQIQSGQIGQLTQAQQNQALQFAQQQGAIGQNGQWVDPSLYWGGGGGVWPYGYLDYYTQLYLWYLLYYYGGSQWDWNQFNCYPGLLC